MPFGITPVYLKAVWPKRKCARCVITVGLAMICWLAATLTNSLSALSAPRVHNLTFNDCPPAITGLKATLPPCAEFVETLIASVSDDLTDAEFIEVEVLSLPPGITVEDVYVDEDGKVYGFITVDCSVAEGQYRIKLRALDEDGCYSLGSLLLCVYEDERIPPEPIVNYAMPGPGHWPRCGGPARRW